MANMKIQLRLQPDLSSQIRPNRKS